MFCKAVANTIVILVSLAASLTGCSLIDENTADCGTKYHIDYEMRLVTNITTELTTELSLAADLELQTSIETSLEDIFTDFAHDVDISFYDVHADSARLFHESHIMDASETSYALHLPARDYMHVSAANLVRNEVVGIMEDERCHRSRLAQIQADTIPSHTTGVFTARLPMAIQEGIDQDFNVHLYMANCASAFVVDTTGTSFQEMKVYVKGFATDFMMSDSLYLFRSTPVIETFPVPSEETGKVAFVSVNFPSRDPENETGTRMTIETEDPFISEISDETLWEVHVLATLPDGSVTRSVLGVRRPLRAGQLMIVRARARRDGAMEPSDNMVTGVSVSIGWGSGDGQDIEL